MNGYLAYYRNKVIELRADTALQAQVKAAIELKARKAWDVSIVLCERKDGSAVTHSTTEF